jgi:hypothetical protein
VNISKAEPTPKKSRKSRPVSEFLKELIDNRTEFGVQKYGQELHTHSGRNPLLDALQESIDLNQYLAQIIMEQEDRITELEEL